MKDDSLMKSRLFWLLTLCLTAFIVLAFSFPGFKRVAEAGPQAAPTPISATAGGNDWIRVTYIDTNTIDQDVNGGSKHTPAYTVLDLQYVVDVSASYANTASCELQWSNDATNWETGALVMNCVGSAGHSMQEYYMFGLYSRISCTLSNTNEITVTAIGKLSQN